MCNMHKYVCINMYAWYVQSEIYWFILFRKSNKSSYMQNACLKFAVKSEDIGYIGT